AGLPSLTPHSESGASKTPDSHFQPLLLPSVLGCCSLAKSIDNGYPSCRRLATSATGKEHVMQSTTPLNIPPFTAERAARFDELQQRLAPLWRLIGRTDPGGDVQD